MMILDTETKRKLREMGAGDLAEAVDAQDDEMYMSLPFAERLKVATDVAYSDFIEAKVRGLLNRAHLRFDYADVRQVALIEERKLDRPMLLELSTCSFAKAHTNVVFHGMTGSGKSYLGCALLKEACHKRLRSLYIRVPDLEAEWKASRNKDQGETKLLKKLANFDCLCLDEWLFDPPEGEFRSFLFELTERRYDTASTIFCTQYPKKDWHHRLGGGVHADSIMDRIVHNARWFYAGDINMREHFGKSNEAV